MSEDKDDLAEAKRIAARLARTPHNPRTTSDKTKTEKGDIPGKQTARKGRVPVGKADRVKERR